MFLWLILFVNSFDFKPYFRIESYIYNEHPFALLEGGGRFHYRISDDVGIRFDGSLFRTFERDTLFYRDIFSKPLYYPYSYDRQPVVTHYNLFEVKFTQGYMYYKNRKFLLKIGRDTIRWPSKLFIYGNGFPLSFLYYLRYTGSKISFSVFNGSLLDTVDLKRLASQLVVLSPNKSFDIYLAEGVIYTRYNVLKYVNPVAPYYVIQRTSDDGPENLMGLIGIRYKGVSFFFLNDDFIIDRGGTSKYGTELDVNIKPLTFSFIRIPRYTYTHYTDTNSWSINGIPLGYPFGPDVLDFYVSFKKGKWSIEGCYLNHGEGRIAEHWEYSGRPKNPPVPSGVVERTLGIMAKYRIRDYGESGLFFYNIKNYMNESGNMEKRVGLYIGLSFSKEFDLW